MLQSIRDKAQGPITWIIILLISSSFVLLGVSNYFLSKSNSPIAATVNGEPITWQNVDYIYEKMRQERKDLPNAPGFEKQLKSDARDILVQKAVLVAGALKKGFRVSEEEIAEFIKTMPYFQEEGQFSKEKYHQVLAQHAIKESNFVKDLQQSLLITQFLQGLTLSNFYTSFELNQMAEIFDQKRDFDVINISLERFKKEIQPKTHELENYYTANKSQFMSPELVNLQYIKLSLKQIMDNIEVSPQELQDYYKENIANFTLPEKINARHILISFSAAEDEAKAKTKIESLIEKLKNGEDFKALVKEYSDDKGSNTKEGELGWFEKGDMVPEFEEAAFKLSTPNEISPVVKTQYGFHLIQLIDKKPETTQAFELVKKLIEEQIKRQKAEPILTQQYEELNTLAYENHSNLNVISEKMGLEIKETPFFDKRGGEGITQHPAVITAAFSPELKEHHLNSEVLPLDDNESFVIFRVKEYKPSSLLDFKTVENKVKELFTNIQTVEKAKIFSETVATAIKSGQSLKEVAKAFQLDVGSEKQIARTDPKISPKILNAAFTLSNPNHKNDKSISLENIILPTGDHAIVILNKVTPGNVKNIPKDNLEAYKQNLINYKADLEYSLYNQALFENIKVKLNPLPNQ
ncbi:MAG: parvulin peptidyl-prolyl isomerase [Francisellaceae bacterium]|nr:parvulin peptidyl-prolyl isomerase [Francisellaceae bacterium]